MALYRANKIHCKVREKQYSINRFPFANYKIMQLSDLHLGFGLKPIVLNEIVGKILLYSPDLVVITGDLIECSIDKVQSGLAPLATIAKNIPTYFVAGNHDFENDPPEKVISILEDLGIQVLVNKNVWIGNEHGFYLAGVSDSIARKKRLDAKYHPDIDTALANTKGAPVILLSHRPILRYLEEHDVDLMLSGHLHGGQIFPFGLLSIYFYEDSGERISIRDRSLDGPKYLHVSKGIGFTTLPLRFLAQSEISLIEISPL